MKRWRAGAIAGIVCGVALAGAAAYRGVGADSMTPRARVGEVVADGAASASPSPAPGVAHVTVEDGGQTATLDLELATTPLQREIGLMNRSTLPADGGMLFLFPGDSNGAFWMKDTLIPLDIAFVDAQDRVVTIRHGVPLDLTPLFPTARYRDVIEVNGGWFAAHGLGVGAVVTFPSGLPAPQ